MESAGGIPDGDWAGTSRLWLDPGQPPHESELALSLRRAAGGRVLLAAYRWSHDGVEHHGVITTAVDARAGDPAMSWLDTFHTAGRLELLTAQSAAPGVIAAHYTFPAPEGPDWGWRIEVHPTATPRLLMFVITPDGEEAPAVEFVLARTTHGVQPPFLP
jgi:hypothetical protein